MSEDLQSLLDKIRNDGLNKAEEQGKAIVAEAEAKAKNIVAEAEAKAKNIVAEAERRSLTYTESSKRTLSQAAANLLLDIDGALLKHLEKILSNGVSSAMLDTAFVADLVRDAVKCYLSSGEVKIAAASALAEAVRAAFSAEAATGAEIVVDPSAGSGFRVMLDGGRIEHSFTAEAVSQALSRQIRPELAELLK